ncbi:AAA family ATPase [Falsiruegeria mediterranea]|uniref:AAA family ATPase n=1 Tax=Falsiruegeria mediterranea TaxID=1280832 RepID=UPI0035229667
MLQQKRNANLLHPTGPLSRLHVNDEDRTAFQCAVFSGLKIYPVIDNLTSYGSLELAFSRKQPNPSAERSTNDDQRTFLSETLRDKEVSDGCRAYTGILGALYSGPYKVVLIDEPEAFLHPPLARLGQANC